MKKLIFSLCVLLALPAYMWSKQRSLDEMKSAAASVINKVSMTRASAPISVLRQDAQFTVLGYKPGGYAVIANDDNFPAVLGYSDGKLSDGDNPGLQWWMNAVSEVLAAKAGAGQTVQRASVPDGYQEAVGPLMTTTWGQSAPYNLLCPTYQSSQTGATVNYLTGCVATAMSQIMHYHKHPVTGEGAKTYWFYPSDGSGRQRLYANFMNTTYDWDNMLDSYTTGSYTEAQGNAVATIMYHCGVALEMNYAEGASGATHSAACLALRNYFRYNDYSKLYMRDYFPEEEWMGIVYRELNDGCPLLYGGNSSSFGGHSFVVDGYDANGLVHVNWGWEGDDDGFYDIAILNPSSIDGTSFLNQDMVVVRPDTDDRYNPTYTSLWGMTAPLTISGNTTTLNYNTISVANLDVDDFYGNIYIMAQNMATNETTSLKTLLTVNQNSAVSYGMTRSFTSSTVSVASLPDGEYRIYIATKSDLEDEPQPVRSNETINNSYIMVKSGSSVTVTAESNPNWTAGIEGVEAGEEGHDSVVRVYDLSGRMVYSAPYDGFKTSDIPADGVLILKSGAMTKKIVK